SPERPYRESVNRGHDSPTQLGASGSSNSVSDERSIHGKSEEDDDKDPPVELVPFCGHLYLRIVPVSPSGEHLNGSIFRSEGEYSDAACGNGCLKKSGSVISNSTTRRCLTVST